MKKIILFFFVLVSLNASGQNIFPIKFKNCNTNGFSFESAVKDAYVSDVEITKVLHKGLGRDVMKRISGTMMLQIAVDTLGNSCLLSFSNNTNCTSWKLKKLKPVIDSELKWYDVKKSVLAIVEIKISESGRITITRYGINRHKNLELLIDRPQPYYGKKRTTNDPDIIVHNVTKTEWRCYNTENSMLLNNNVQRIDTQNDGVVWFCTDYSVVRSENDVWTVFDNDVLSQFNKSDTSLLSSSNDYLIVYDLFVDNQDRVWVDAYSRFYIYDNQKWLPADSVFKNELKSIGCESTGLLKLITKETDGTVWLTLTSDNTNRIISFKDNQFSVFENPNDTFLLYDYRDIYTASNNVLWMATDSGLVRVEDGKSTIYNTKNSEMPNNSIAAVEGDSKGNIWVAISPQNNYGGLLKIGADGKWNMSYSGDSESRGNNVLNIVKDNDVLWLSMYPGGLMRVDPEKILIFDSYNSAISEQKAILAFHVDKNGNKWIGSRLGLIVSNVK